jgi:hypothetical protein
MCNLIAHTPTAAWSGNLTQVGSFHTSRYHARLAEFTPLGATAGWLKLAAQVIGASSAGHRRDEPHHQPVIDMMILIISQSST